MINGLWNKINGWIPFNKKTITEELATRRRSPDFSAFNLYLPDPDPILKKLGKDFNVYRELLSDPHVWACVQSRKAGVTSLEWGIDRGKAKTKEAETIEKIFNNLDLYRIISEILDASMFGFQPLEVIWEYKDGLILPKDVIAKPPEWFLFDPENVLKFKTKETPLGEYLPEKKFLCPSYFSSYQNPYGEKTLSRVFWSVSFKRGGMKFWAIFTEKYGMPFLVGKTPRGSAETEVEDLAEKLELMVQDAICVIPDDSSVEIKEAGGKGASAEIYDKLVDKMNAEISKGILGQTLTTEVGKTGSYAASKTHMDVRGEIVDSDRRMAEKTINQLIGWIYEINWKGTSDKPVFSMWQEEDVDKDLAERDKILTDSGVKLSKKYFMKAYGFEEEDLEINTTPTPPKPQTPLQFAEGKQDFIPREELDKIIASLDDKMLQTQIEDVLKPVMDLIQNSKNPQEAMDLLAETYPDMDIQKLEDLLTKLIFISEVWGQINAGN